MTSSAPSPTHFGILIFPGFEALDAFGPLEVVNGLSMKQELKLDIVAATLDPVSTRWEGTHSVGQSIVPTCTFADVPALDVLLIPGGFGAFNPTPELLQFLQHSVPKAKHVITVCNGSAMLALTGLLDGKNATTNKSFWTQCTALGPQVNWIAKARWVQDGNIWTSSGVSAGIDATLAWTAEVFGEEVAAFIANGAEFMRAESASADPFAAMFGCEDVPAGTRESG